MVRTVVGLAVLLIGIGVAGLRSYLYSDTSSTGTADVIASVLSGFIGDEAGPAEQPAGEQPTPGSVALQPSQIQQVLEQELAAAQQAALRAQAAFREQAPLREQAGRGQPPLDGATPHGPAAIALPRPGDCRLDGATTGDDCAPATTGPASAAQVVVIRPRR